MVKTTKQGATFTQPAVYQRRELLSTALRCVTSAQEISYDTKAAINTYTIYTAIMIQYLNTGRSQRRMQDTDADHRTCDVSVFRTG